MEKIIQYLLGRIIPAAINLISVVIVAETYGAEQFGIYNLIFSASVFVKTFIGNWYSQFSIRYYYTDTDRVLEASPAALLITSIVSSISLVVVLYIIFGSTLGFVPILFACLILVMDSIMEFGLALRRARFEAPQYGLALTARAALFLGGALVLSILPQYEAVLLAMLIATGIGAVISGGHRAFSFPFRANLLYDFIGPLRYGLFAAFSSASAVATAFFLKLNIERLHDASVLGHFAVINDLVQNAVTVFSMILVLYFHPLVLKKRAEGSIASASSTFRMMCYAIAIFAIAVIALSIAFVNIYPIIPFKLEAFSEFTLVPSLSVLYILVIAKMYIIDFQLQVRQDVYVLLIGTLLMFILLFAFATTSTLADINSSVWMAVGIVAVVNVGQLGYLMFVKRSGAGRR